MSGCGLPSGWRSRNILRVKPIGAIRRAVRWCRRAGRKSQPVPDQGTSIEHHSRGGCHPGKCWHTPVCRMMSRFQRSGRCGKSTVRMYPEMTGTHLTIRLPLIERRVIGRDAVQSSPGKAVTVGPGGDPEEVQGIDVVRSVTEGVERFGAVG
jgi:hypothetical protein